MNLPTTQPNPYQLPSPSPVLSLAYPNAARGPVPFVDLLFLLFCPPARHISLIVVPAATLYVFRVS